MRLNHCLTNNDTFKVSYAYSYNEEFLMIDSSIVQTSQDCYNLDVVVSDKEGQVATTKSYEN